MARYYLVNSIKFASAAFLPGTLVNSAVGDPIQKIRDAGGLEARVRTLEPRYTDK